MSESTTQELLKAKAAVTEQRQAADSAKDALTRQIAEGLPTRIDAIAKRAAQAEPEVTKELGAEGVRKLRAELAAEAKKLGAELNGAADQINWPIPYSDYSQSSTQEVQNAFFHYFYGERVNRVASIFKKRGYDIHDDNSQRSQGIVHPHSLYEKDDMAAVAEAQNALAAAERDYVKAKQADDDDIVADIWSDS